jgi:hypothetical protein
MEISLLKFQFALTSDDLYAIRDAIRHWGKPSDYVDGFTGAELYRHFERWKQFVSTDWSRWDISEYDHDIGCRYWIQVAIEHSSPATRSVLERQVASLDAQFQTQMRPAKRPGILDCAPLGERPYFWETHTLHPEL